MKSAVLVTGPTGLLGTEIIKTLIRDEECPVYALVRAENEDKALHRLRSFWWEEPILISALEDRIKIVCGDITVEDLGMTEETAAGLAASVEYVIHTAAETGIQNARSKLQEINTNGTLNVVAFAKRIQREAPEEIYSDLHCLCGRRQKAPASI